MVRDVLFILTYLKSQFGSIDYNDKNRSPTRPPMMGTSRL